jgi:hypothetical protein
VGKAKGAERKDGKIVWVTLTDPSGPYGVVRPLLPRAGTTRAPVRGPLVQQKLGAVYGGRVAAAQVEAALHSAVVEARTEGATWQEVADALGVSVKVAWARYTEDSRWTA